MLKIKLLTNKELAPYLTDMWSLYQQYYNDPKEMFMERIEQIERQAVFFDKHKIVGFTGIVVDRNVQVSGKSRTFIGIEQSVIDKKYRNKNLIQRTLTRLFFQEKWKNAFTHIYIWSASASYIPYLIFTQYLKKAYPSHFCTPCEEIKDLMNYLGKKHLNAFPFQYYHDTPFSSFGLENCMLDTATKVTEKELQNPNIAYYHTLVNEGRKYLKEAQHELLVTTIAPANWENFNYWVKRFFNKLIKKIIIPY